MKSKPAAIFLIAGAALFFGTHFLWLDALPERVATHFDGAGRPDGWMSRERHGLWMAALGGGLPLVVIGLCALMRFVSPSRLNVPNAAYWRAPEHYAVAHRLLLAWSLWLGTASLLFCTGLNYLLVEANRLSPPQLALTPTLALAGAYLLVVLVLVVALVVRFAKPGKG